MPQAASLEELFLDLTERAPRRRSVTAASEAAAPAAAARRPRRSRRRQSTAGNCSSSRAQKRTYLGLGAAVLVPCAFVLALDLPRGRPNDIPLGRYVRERAS